MCFNNVWMLFYRVYWFYVKKKKFIGYTNLFFPNDYEKNDKIILKYFQ